MHVQGKELIEAHGGLRCFRLASGAVAVNSALEEADGVEGRINALLFAERIPFEWRRATPQIGRRSQRPWLGRGEDANGHLKSRDDAISIMIHGLQGAAKLVNNVGRDSCALDCTSCAYYEVSDGAYDKESSTNRSRKGPHGTRFSRGLLRRGRRAIGPENSSSGMYHHVSQVPYP